MKNKQTWKMSFFDGTLDRNKLVELVDQAEDIRYTYGLGYKSPTTNRKPITREEALKIISEEHLLDADNVNGYLHLNAYSSNDLF